MKKRLLSLALALVLCLGLTSPAIAAGQNFSDVPISYWAYSAIERAAEEGWVKGVGNGMYRPDGVVTNEQIIIMLTRTFYWETVDKWGLTGVMSYAWEPYYMAGREVGMLEGTTIINSPRDKYDRIADISLPVTRYDMAQMMSNILQNSGFTISDEQKSIAQRQIGDWYEVPANYQTAVINVYGLKVISGLSDGTFGGNKTMTRAQAAVILCRLSDTIGAAKGSLATQPTNQGTGTGRYDISQYTVPADTNKDGYLTEAEVLAMLTQLQAEYPEGSPWGSDKSYTSSTFGAGRECAAYAFMISDRIFGNLPKYPVTSFANVRPGDYVRAERANGTGHSAIFSDTSDPKSYHTTDGNNGGEVSWSGWGYYASSEVSLNLSAPTSERNTLRIYSRYPDRDYVSTNCIMDMDDLYPEVRCQNCGYIMRETGSDKFDTNSSDGGYRVCEICHDFFVCGQCRNCQLFRDHEANCKG